MRGAGKREEPGQGRDGGGEEGQTQNHSGSWVEKEYQETGPLFREEGAIKVMHHLKFLVLPALS